MYHLALGSLKHSLGNLVFDINKDAKKAEEAAEPFV